MRSETFIPAENSRIDCIIEQNNRLVGSERTHLDSMFAIGYIFLRKNEDVVFVLFADVGEESVATCNLLIEGDVHIG